jgi:transcriptional regulator with XRE-family HTH domain
VSALERGLYNPTIERLEQVANVLEIDPFELFKPAAPDKSQLGNRKAST